MDNKEQIIIFDFEANKNNTIRNHSKSKRRKSNKRKNKITSLQASENNQKHPVQSNTSDTYKQKYEEACIANAKLIKEINRFQTLIDTYEKSLQRKRILIERLTKQSNYYFSLLVKIKEQFKEVNNIIDNYQ